MAKTKSVDDLLIVKILKAVTEFWIGGTKVTSTAAELNILDGVTADKDEINKLDGVTAGTVTASKALVVGANKNLDVLAIADLKLGAGAGVSVSKTAAEINLLLAGLAAGKKVAFGTAAVDAATYDVATGLTTVEHVVVSMVGDPSMTHMYSTATIGNQTDAPIAGSIRIKSWKPTSQDNVTPAAADTVFGNVAWVAIGE